MPELRGQGNEARQQPRYLPARDGIRERTSRGGFGNIMNARAELHTNRWTSTRRDQQNRCSAARLRCGLQTLQLADCLIPLVVDANLVQVAGDVIETAIGQIAGQNSPTVGCLTARPEVLDPPLQRAKSLRQSRTNFLGIGDFRN
jgi:hypothetical protein